MIKIIKRIKLKRELSKPREAIRIGGALKGYSCPRCGQEHCIYDFCLACGQRLSYDYSNRGLFRFKDVDEMCEKLDIANKQLNPNGNITSLVEERKKCKIDLKV